MFYITVLKMDANRASDVVGYRDPEVKMNLAIKAKFERDEAERTAKKLTNWVDAPGAYVCVCTLEGTVVDAYY